MITSKVNQSSLLGILYRRIPIFYKLKSFRQINIYNINIK